MNCRPIRDFSTMSRSQLIDDVNALAATEPPTIDRLLDRRPDATPRAAMRALSTWRIQRWLAAEPGQEKAAFEALIAGVVDDAEILALRGEMAAGADADRPLAEMHPAMDERLPHWARRALAGARRRLRGGRVGGRSGHVRGDGRSS